MKKLYLTLLIVLSVFMFNSSAYAKSTSSSMISEKNIYVNLLVHSSGGGSHEGGVYIASKAEFRFCDEPGVLRTLKILGTLVNILKILVPIILIVVGVVAYGKAAIGDDAEMLEKTTHSLIVKVVVGLLVFFIPTIVIALIDLSRSSTDRSDVNSTFGMCWKCFKGYDVCDNYIDRVSGSSSSSGSGESTTSSEPEINAPYKPVDPSTQNPSPILRGEDPTYPWDIFKISN